MANKSSLRPRTRAGRECRTSPVASQKKAGGIEHRGRSPIDFPPEVNAAAVSLLRRRLEEEKADLEAQLKVVDRLLGSALA